MQLSQNNTYNANKRQNPCTQSVFRIHVQSLALPRSVTETTAEFLERILCRRAKGLAACLRQ